MKKLLAIGSIIVVVFILIILLNNQSNKEKLKDNPYGTSKLEQATIDLIGNENYNNIILPDALLKEVESGKPVTAYFFSPLCKYCVEMTPVMMPIAKEMNVDVKQFNVLEFNQESVTYRIEATPTMIHFENGEEVARMVGGAPKEKIEQFFAAVKDESLREEYWDN